MNTWEDSALKLLNKSLNSECALSTKTESLAQHISAFANYSGGGFLAIGINNDDKSSPLSKVEMDEFIQ